MTLSIIEASSHHFFPKELRYKEPSPLLSEVGTAPFDRIHLQRSEAAEGLLGELAASPDSCCKMERSRQDQGEVQRPQSLNTNVLLMPRCEGHQEHELKEAFIVASV